MLFPFIDLFNVYFDIVRGFVVVVVRGSLQLLVLESIFGDNVFVLDRQNGLRCFQVL